MARREVTRTQQDDGTWRVSGWRDAGVAECPDCHKDIDLIEEVEEWEANTGRITAGGWGLPHGYCESCHLAVHMGFDEDYVIRLGR